MYLSRIWLLSEILCPKCHEPLAMDESKCSCRKGHQYLITKNIIDLLPDSSEEGLEEEEEHWDKYAQRGKASIEINSYIRDKIFNDYDEIFYKQIVNEWPDYNQRHISVAEIGCGSGSAIRFLEQINFKEVDYVGIDLSLKSMKEFKGVTDNRNWKVKFIKASANGALFNENALDMVFSTSALHHLEVADVIKWVSKSLRPGGLFILNEPSDMNPFAKLGRKLVKDFHTKGEKPLRPKEIRKIANKCNLNLKYEKGLHFLLGPMMYLAGIIQVPIPISALITSISKIFDRLVSSASWNYSFIQVYKRERNSEWRLS